MATVALALTVPVALLCAGIAPAADAVPAAVGPLSPQSPPPQPPPPPGPPNGVTLGVNPRPPIPGETVIATGRVDTRFRRPIAFQFWTGRFWRTEKQGTTTVRGEYRLPVTISTTGYIRALAKPVRIKGKHHAVRTSSTRLLTTTAQTADVDMLPPVAQPSAVAAPASGAKNVLSATFTPPRPGRTALVQVRVGTIWRSVGQAAEDAAGRVAFRVSQDRRGRDVVYRALLTGSHGAPPLPTEARGTVSSVGPLLWEDQFDGTSLGPDWMLMDPEYGHVANRRCSKGSMDAVRVRGGTLDLQVKPDPERQGRVCRAYGHANTFQLNGTVSTRRTEHFGFGTAAARIKFHRLRGQHSAFWMTTDAVNTGTEVDVAEWFGRQTKTMANYIYVRKQGVKKRKYGGAIADLQSYLTGRGDAWYSRYHVFSLERTPTTYTFRIDGKTTFTTTKGATKKAMFLWLTNLSGDYELHFMDPKDYPQTTSVDWVRIWGS